MLWRPLTWKFIKENGGSCIADASLSYKETSIFLAAKEDKKLTHDELRDDDVLFGWNGRHLGNLRFLQLLWHARPAFWSKGLSSSQQKIIAYEVMRAIDKRGGRFFSVNPNPILPPKLEPKERAVTLIMQTLKRGNVVLYQPPPNPLKKGRASCVVECELAPQRSLYGKEILFNKRFKKSLPEGA